MSTRSRTPLVVAAVLVVVLVIGLVAVLASGGDDDDGGDDTASTATVVPGEEIDPLDAVVEVQGDPLPEFTGNPDPAIGLVPPTMTGTDYSGEPITIEPGTGGPMMVVFLAHWCPHCNREVPVLLEWRDAGDIPEGLQVFGVSTAVSPDRPNYPPGEWLVDKGWEWPVLADSVGTVDIPPTALEAYGVSGFPFITIIGADGTVKLRLSGEIPLEDLDAAVDEALAS